MYEVAKGRHLPERLQVVVWEVVRVLELAAEEPAGKERMSVRERVLVLVEEVAEVLRAEGAQGPAPDALLSSAGDVQAPPLSFQCRLVGDLRNILCIRADVLRHVASRFTSLLRRRSWIRVSHSLLFYTQRSRIAGPCCEHLSPLSYHELLGVFAHVGKGVCSFLKLGGGRLPEGDHFHLAPHVHV